MFQNIDKFYRRYNAVLLVFPTDQSLGANNLLAVGIHNRLVAQVESFAMIHNAIANYIDTLDGETLVVVYVVLKNIQLTQVIILGFVIGKAQARINGFYADIKFFEVDGSCDKRKNHAGSIHIKIMKGIVLDTFVQVFQVFNRGFLADNSKLGSIHSVPITQAMGFYLDHL